MDYRYASGGRARLSHPYYLAVHTLLRYGNKGRKTGHKTSRYDHGR
jgi:hypothetical protein